MTHSSGRASSGSNIEPVNQKVDFARRYREGEFGNHAPTWEVDEFLSVVDYLPPSWKLFGLRTKIAGGPTWYNKTIPQMRKLIKKAVAKHGKEALYVSAMAPHDNHGTIQGNLMQTQTGPFILEYWKADVPMREAITKYKMKTAKGIDALRVCKHYMNEASYETLKDLIDAYPDHVIEFSCFSTNWGTHRGHNTCFWEVRLY